MERKLTVASFNVGKIKAEDRNDVDNLPHECRSCWYLSRKEIEYNSPSRKDGIDSRKEAQLRMLYCSFLQDVGMRLKMPQVTIATAMMLCHRFYLHQSHAKNEWQTIATVCMFLASKVEDTPCRLDKVIIVAYETMYQRDPAALRRIHQEDVFTKQKALILVGERLLQCTIGFDFNIQHPYKPLHEAFKKLQITQKDVRQAAWNFVNDWLRTTLCLQYKPHYIAAGSLYLAAKHHNMKLPSQNGYGWWQELNISPQQLDAIVQQMTELRGYKRQPVVSALVEKLKPVKSPIAAKAKEEVVSSPDSCVLSGPGSSVRSPNHAVNDRGSVSRLTDPSDHSSSKCSLNTENPGELRNSESPNSDVEDSDQLGDAHNKINVDRIRALMRARKRSRGCSKSTTDVELSEDALIEKELEAGVELSAGRYEKKQRLLEVL